MDNKTIGTISFDWPHSKRHGVKYCDDELEVCNDMFAFLLSFEAWILSLAVFDQ